MGNGTDAFAIPAQQESPIKTAEMTTEQNYNMIDGVLNNTPTMSELEAKANVEEDPVCGRGHCHVTPYWTKRLGKDRIVAYQASRRGGTLYCAIAGDRVRIGGKVTMFSIDEILAVPT